MKLLCLLFFLTGSVSACAARRVLSPPLNLYIRQHDAGNFFKVSLRVDVVNLSNVQQEILVIVRDLKLEQGINLASEADGDASYFNWRKNPTFPASRGRIFDFDDLERTVNVPADGKAMVVFAIYCRLDNTGPDSGGRAGTSTCNSTADTIAGWSASPRVSVLAQNVNARFEIRTTGKSADRGALIAGSSIVSTVGQLSNDLSREMNGGRPF